MAERRETAIAIDDALETARRIVATIEGIRAVSTLPNVDGFLRHAPRQIAMIQLSIAGGDLTSQLLQELARVTSSLKTDA